MTVPTSGGPTWGGSLQVSFSKSTQRKKDMLELVYSDVCGPMKIKTLGGCSYFVTFIDDHSCKVWAYAIRSKDQVCDVFKQFHVMVERECGKLMKCIRTDNGGEYIGSFDQYYKLNGIRHEQTVPNTPQYNGVSERMNRTIVEKIRCMLSQANLPKFFWGKAMCAAVQIINLSHTTIFEGEVPDEVWSRKDVSYKHLRTFGCKAFVYVPKDERSKLDNKSLPSVFLSYGDEKFGYKVYDPISKKTVRRRDVYLDSDDEDVLNNGIANNNGVQDNNDDITGHNNMNDDLANESGDDQLEVQVDGPEVQVHAPIVPTEMNSIHKNNTYVLVDKDPDDRKVLKNRWIFKLKTEEGILIRGTRRVVKMTSIRIVLGLVARFDFELEQLDVKTAFLHGDLEEDIYMKQPEGFEIRGKNILCASVKRVYMVSNKPHDNDFIILLLYVDNMLFVGKNFNNINNLKEKLSRNFEMKDLGMAKKILGMEIKRSLDQGKLWLSHERYILKVLQRFNMELSKPVSCPLSSHFEWSKDGCPKKQIDLDKMKNVLYASTVGSLMYAMICTRPDIAYSVVVVSKFLSNPGKEHWEEVKWILRYLKGTTEVGICYGDREALLEGFTNADMAGDLDSKRSTSGYLFNFVGGAISWQSKLQKCVALSTTEAEYIAITECDKEMLWLKKFFRDVGVKQDKFIILCDSQSSIHLRKNPYFHSKSKHIKIRSHWVRDVVEGK
ncbi:transmembrane signal receptor [Lithospermum erythrorhizon]|uniref:Transmembrane signal receptor n=1 Tax=Lithospermum erythrorhizon TaxID=34254 RepID=A0AAV3RZ51_LITER